ncbi:MAG: alkyl sulfatase dimerization domain-containing protein [Caulobacteraceae bacterium]
MNLKGEGREAGQGMRLRSRLAALTIGLALGLSYALSAAAQAPAKAEPASAATLQANHRAAQDLPTGIDQDSADAARGFIATRTDPRIVDATGRLVWDLSAKLPDQPSDTVNPSLWHQAKLLDRTGLFKVADGVYQVRGFDAANMTVIEGARGYVVIDPLNYVETAAAALALVRAQLGDRPITGVVYTHPHPDHYGGSGGLFAGGVPPAGDVPVVAPMGFTEALFDEQVMTGNVIGRRGQYQFGVGLPVSPTGSMGIGVALGIAQGYLSLVPPTLFISKTGQRLTIDGVDLEFQLTPNTEAAAEMNLYLPKSRVLCLAENANHSLHNLLPPRGAPVRDARAWSDGLEDALTLFGGRTDAVILGHTWPVFGAAAVRRFIIDQSDLYKYILDQTIREMNEGLTPNEIATRIVLPKALQEDWSTRGYYGSLSFDVRAVYQRYLGWYDGNPAHLDPLPPATAGAAYVKAMGGPAKVLALAAEAHHNGNDQWAVELLNNLVMSDPQNREARELMASCYIQLGYRSENAVWRNIYLSAATDLRQGPHGTNILSGSAKLLAKGPDTAIADLLAVRLDPAKAAGVDMTIRFVFPERQKSLVLMVRNSVLRYGRPGQAADVTVTLPRDSLLQHLFGPSDHSELPPGSLSGRRDLANRFFDLFAAPAPGFSLVSSNLDPDLRQ